MRPPVLMLLEFLIITRNDFAVPDYSQPISTVHVNEILLYPVLDIPVLENGTYPLKSYQILVLVDESV